MNRELSVDKQLEILWNENHSSETVKAEQFWEFCRYLENAGYLEGNREFVGTKSLGPFNIAYKDIDSKDVIDFFLSTVIPILLQLSNQYSFKDFYALYLLPAAEILLSASKHIVLVNDSLQWDLLLYIKNKNKESIFPTINEVSESEQFCDFPNIEIKKALTSLKKASTLFGKNELIRFDHDGRIECLV